MCSLLYCSRRDHFKPKRSCDLQPHRIWWFFWPMRWVSHPCVDGRVSHTIDGKWIIKYRSHDIYIYIACVRPFRILTHKIRTICNYFPREYTQPVPGYFAPNQHIFQLVQIKYDANDLVAHTHSTQCSVFIALESHVIVDAQTHTPKVSA